MRWKFRQTSLTLVICLATLAGLGLARTGHATNLADCEVSGILLVLFWRLRSPVTLGIAILFGLSFGLWRGAVFMQKLADYQPYYYQKLTVHVQAIME